MSDGVYSDYSFCEQSSSSSLLAPEAEVTAQACKACLESLLTWLAPHSTLDVVEYQTTLEVVCSTLSYLIRQGKLNGADFFRAILKDIHEATIEFHQLLTAWQDGGQLESNLTLPRRRAVLDHLNAILASQAHNVREIMNMSQVGACSDVMAHCDIFGRELFALRHLVPMKEFISRLECFLHRSLAPQLINHLQATLDSTDSGMVSAHRYSALLDGFGGATDNSKIGASVDQEGIASCLDRLQELASSSWFHGFTSAAEAQALLSGKCEGTYLVRFAVSQPCTFAVSFVVGKQLQQDDNSARNGGSSSTTICDGISSGVRHALIPSAADGGGFMLGRKYFTSLPALVQANGAMLKFPCVSYLNKPLSNMSKPGLGQSSPAVNSWFHGFISYAESVAMLKPQPPGTFLARFSHSQPGALVIAYAGEDGEVRQSLVIAEPDRGGYSVGAKVFNTQMQRICVCQLHCRCFIFPSTS
jgi:hypothetical protein